MARKNAYLFGCDEHVPGHQNSYTMDQEYKEHHPVPAKCKQNYETLNSYPANNVSN